MFFEIVSDIANVEIIARGKGVKSQAKLREKYGPGAWRKMKGTAQVRLSHGIDRIAEIHWYEAHGIGRKEFKIKRFLD